MLPVLPLHTSFREACRSPCNGAILLHCFVLPAEKKLSPVTHLILPTGQETVKREIKKIPIILCIPNAPFIRSIPQSFPASGCFPRLQAAAGEGTSLAFVLRFTFRSPQGLSALPHSAHILEGNACYSGARASPRCQRRCNLRARSRGLVWAAAWGHFPMASKGQAEHVTPLKWITKGAGRAPGESSFHLKCCSHPLADRWALL